MTDARPGFDALMEQIYAENPYLRLMRAIRLMTQRYGDSCEAMTLGTASPNRWRRARWQSAAVDRLSSALYHLGREDERAQRTTHWP
jgi:hypothetical protein